MARKKQLSSEPEWTARDEALWSTAEMGVLLRQNRLKQRQRMSVPFAMHHASDETPYAHGPFRLLSLQAAGDGSYVHNGSSLIATGRGAVPMMLGFAAARAAGNASRRRHAAAMAQSQWTPIDTGTLTVSDYGFYMHTPTAIHAWNWDSIQMATLIGPGSLQIFGQSAHGAINWILESDWAELVFLFWATVRCPDHEQLLGRTWLPDDWVTKAFIHAQTNPRYPTQGDFRDMARTLGLTG
ncbi:hypothetical protein [Arthrobacter agilis]|uniref:hypothetical protein n=3 Tax=Arthrobacter agilis TaxID=37921 RepID=UPI000F7F5A0F|nr:hypothetical protein [Arthrobacter agilis]